MSVLIREATPDDAEQLIAHVKQVTAEPHIDLPLTADEFTYTVEEEQEIIKEYQDTDNCIFLVAEVPADDPNNPSDKPLIIGVLNLRGGKRRANRHAVTLGMSIQKAYRNQGVGTKLLGKAVNWAADNPIITRIELQVYVRNVPAIHLYEKFGFRIEGQRRHAFFQNEEYIDDLIMGLLLDA